MGQRLVSIIVLIGTLIVGWLLIKGVYREIEQRQQLQILAGQLESANTALKELDKARADFITIASHQLRTPPATIKWYVAAILSGDFGALLPDVKAQLEKVQATNNSQISLIDDMLNASRIERGKMEFLFEEVEVEPMAKMTYDQLMPLASMKGIKLIYNPPKTPLPKVMADIEKLRQVMNNFIDNAIKYTDKGTITAELFQEGDNIRFQVTDNGMGIKPELAPHLFSKYARGQDSVTHAQGLGLGLYVCKMVVDQHHGKIWAESPGEGKGSTFIFTIPIHNNLKATTLVDLKMDGVK
jgi:signal transduction histidine kinase